MQSAIVIIRTRQISILKIMTSERKTIRGRAAKRKTKCPTLSGFSCSSRCGFPNPRNPDKIPPMIAIIESKKLLKTIVEMLHPRILAASRTPG